MIIAQIVDDRAPQYERKSQRIDFEALNEDPTARAAYDEELRDWDAILLDGLGDES